MKKQRTIAPTAPRVIRWAGAALAAASFALASASASAEIQSVHVATANFRAGPSTKHPILFSADRFYPVEIIERAKDWVRIRDFEGDEAWVAGWLLDDTDTVVVTRNVINVRDKPNTSSSIVHTAERGAVFKLTGSKGSWVKVADEEGEIGWIHRNLLWGSISEPANKSKGKAKTEAKPDEGSKDKGDDKSGGDDKPAAETPSKPEEKAPEKPTAG